MNKRDISFLIVFFVMIGVGIALVVQSPGRLGRGKEQESTGSNKEQLIGGQKDEHGCLTAAGYSWCDNKQKCLRQWEEACESTSSAKPKTEVLDIGNTEPQILWKTYENTEYGYKIRYPETCIFGALPDYCKDRPEDESPEECSCFFNASNSSNVAFQKYTGEKPSISLATMFIAHNNTPAYNPLDEVDLITWLKEKFPYQNIPDETNMVIGNTRAARVYTPGGVGTFAYENIYFFKDGMLFNISLNEVENKENKRLYDAMIASFDFIE